MLSPEEGRRPCVNLSKRIPFVRASVLPAERSTSERDRTKKADRERAGVVGRSSEAKAIFASGIAISGTVVILARVLGSHSLFTPSAQGANQELHGTSLVDKTITLIRAFTLDSVGLYVLVNQI